METSTTCKFPLKNACAPIKIINCPFYLRLYSNSGGFRPVIDNNNGRLNPPPLFLSPPLTSLSSQFSHSLFSGLKGKHHRRPEGIIDFSFKIYFLPLSQRISRTMCLLSHKTTNHRITFIRWCHFIGHNPHNIIHCNRLPTT